MPSLCGTIRASKGIKGRDIRASSLKVFGPLRKITEYEDKQCLGVFSLEMKGHRKEDINVYWRSNQFIGKLMITNIGYVMLSILSKNRSSWFPKDL